jgi:hypothetical protein
VSRSFRTVCLSLPEAVDDYVEADNVRFIDTFVDGLDIAAMGFARVILTAKADQTSSTIRRCASAWASM